MSSFAVLLDANVILPAAIRDTLVRAAAAGLYRLHWSERILEEVRRNLVATGRTSPEQAQQLVQTMKAYFPEASVSGYEVLVSAMTNSSEDRHVLAAAVASRSQVIVTSNLTDFPSSALDPFGVEAQSPDQFLIQLLDLYPDALARIVMKQADALQNPPMTYVQVLESIALHAPRFAASVRRIFEEDLGMPADTPNRALDNDVVDD